MMIGTRFRAYVELARPANVITAFADVLAGFAAAGAVSLALHGGQADLGPDLAALLAATAGLYAGGVVLNDVFDAPLDAIERPERPIPSGRVTRRSAAWTGALLLCAGVGSAAFAGVIPLLVAASVAACAVTYDAVGKHHAFWGPVNMGLCRGGNLLLGASAIPSAMGDVWFISLLPVAYIGAVTAISRGEVHGGSRSSGALAVALAASVWIGLLIMGLRMDYRTLHALPFIGLFALFVFPAFVRAASTPTPDRIRNAVKVGVLSLIVMDSAIAAGFAGWGTGLAVLLLLPLSLVTARLYAVT